MSSVVSFCAVNVYDCMIQLYHSYENHRPHCRPGYYRERLGFYLGRCVPCRCNRHSDKCLDRSGICVECKDNTEGDHCERCKPGFYGNGVQSSCSPCPCPLTVTSNNFATGCAENNGRLQCFCKPGYSGENCERCAPGYFGNPAEVGGQCRPCQCGNSNPTNCDPLTGQCGTCPVCDSCVKTLLGDLNKMDIDIQTIKLQVQNANASAAAQERMNALDRAIASTGVSPIEPNCLFLCPINFVQFCLLCNSISVAHQLTEDRQKLHLLMCIVRASCVKLVPYSEDKARTLLNLLSLHFISDLIDRLGTKTSGNVGEKLAEAERMLKELRNRNFGQEKSVAEREKNESKKCNYCSLFLMRKISLNFAGCYLRGQDHDINKTLSRAKEVARGANDTVAKVMDKLQPILSDLENLNTITGNIPNLDDFNHALREAEDSVNILTNTLPSLVQKLNNLSKSQPANNISENIDRIRELIEQAREAANKINVPMKFNGKSGVEVRLPNDLNDLKAYNSLVLYLKRPSEPARGDNRQKRQPDQDMFVLYLGHKNVSEYIGMALVDKKLVTVYKLGKDKEAKIESDLTVSTAVFDNAEFKRMLTTTLQDSSPPRCAYPANTVLTVNYFFQPPASLKYDNFIGDIELGVLNERLVSLYNFRETFNLNTTIDKPDARCFKADTNANSFFLLHSRSKFSVDVRTVTSEGIIFYVADKAERSYMALYILKGRFFFSFVVDGIKLKIKSKAKYNDGQWHTVVFSREGNTGKLVIDGLRTRQSSITTSSSLEVESPFYLGGLPSGKGQQRRKQLPRDSFQGCIRNFKLDGSQLSVPSRMLGVTPCFDGKSEPGAYFSAEGGYVILDNAFVVGRDFELLFEVRARSQTGVLFHISSPQGNYLSLYMHKGKVTVSVNNGAGEFSTSVDPQQSLCDGQSHRIAGKYSAVIYKTQRYIPVSRLPTWPQRKFSYAHFLGVSRYPNQLHMDIPEIDCWNGMRSLSLEGCILLT
uniref:Laminin subunit alpha 3 n=1 Tax=Callorhinchus milii TaxID=7868 RepID=A0A4W3GY82_CALMI